MAQVTGTGEHVLEARELYRFFRSGDEETLALRGVSLSVGSGELLAIIGPSGSGKSTLLACLAGLDEPAGGTIRILGHRINARPEAERALLRGRHVGVLFQSENLFPHLTVAQNVKLVQNLPVREKSRRRRPVEGPSASVAEILESVRLGSRANAYPSQLSGGEAARAGLAVALANRPPLLLADEPTGELDSDTERQLLRLLRQQADQGCAVLVVTHSPEVVAGADRVISLSDGRVLSSAGASP